MRVEVANFFWIIALIFRGFSLNAQVLTPPFPVTGKVFYTNQIPFLLPPVQGANLYKIQWRYGSVQGQSPKYIEKMLESPGGILGDFQFGARVFWRYQALASAGTVLFTSNEMFFEIAPIPDYLTEYRLRILQPDSGQAAYFFDAPGAAYDKQGNLIWFLKPGAESRRIMDLRLNSDGLLSFISIAPPVGRGLITTLTLDTLFDAHQIASQHPMMPYLTFHHHMEVLPDRSVVLIGDVKPSPGYSDLNMGTGNVKRFPQVVLNLEQNGKVRWLWEADKVLTLKDNDCYGHINSVAFNSKLNQIAFSLKDLSMVMITERGQGNSFSGSIQGVHEKTDKKRLMMAAGRTPVVHAPVSTTPGRLQSLEVAPPMPANSNTKVLPKVSSVRTDSVPAPFSGQHSVLFNSKGNLVFFNNNSYNPHAKYSTLMEVESPQTPAAPVNVLWEHVLQFQDTLPKKAMGRGSVQLINDYTFMTYMGQVSRIFESDTSFHVRWMGLMEHRAGNRVWSVAPGYKAFRASSLYPALFAADIISKKGPASSKAENTIRIFNLGSETDSYQILDEAGKIYYTKEISGNHKAEIPVSQNWPKSIRIKSSLNPSNETNLSW